jgi:hypothetical protein
MNLLNETQLLSQFPQNPYPGECKDFDTSGYQIEGACPSDSADVCSVDENGVEHRLRDGIDMHGKQICMLPQLPCGSLFIDFVYMARVKIVELAIWVFRAFPGNPSSDFSRYTVQLSQIPRAKATLALPDIGGAEHMLLCMLSQVERVPRKKEHQLPSNVHFPEQDFLLAPLPLTRHVNAYLCTCLREDVRLLVSAHEIEDGGPYECSNFWEQSVLSEMELDGWSIETQQRQVFVYGTVKNRKGVIPRVEETTFIAKHDQEPSRIMTHLYYRGWTGCEVAPDEVLLYKLLSRMQELSPDPRKPIAINCHAGRGRTINIALPYLIRKQIDRALEQGADIAKMQINLPELFLQFNKQRDLDLQSIRDDVVKTCIISECEQIFSITDTYVRSRFLDLQMLADPDSEIRSSLV